MAFYGNAANATVTTDVSNGSYGGGESIPVITIQSGRLHAINTADVTYSTLNANANVGTIGSYAFMQQASGNTQYAPGDTLAGSSLRYSDATGRPHPNTTPTGNWRCMGYDSGAALTNSGTGNGNASADATFSGGNVQGDRTANISGNIVGDVSLSSGNVTTNNVNVNVSGNVQGGKGAGASVSSSGTLDVDNLSVGGNVATDELSITGNTGTIDTDELGVTGNVSVNVNLGTITVNTVVAYSSTLWLRYS